MNSEHQPEGQSIRGIGPITENDIMLFAGKTVENIDLSREPFITFIFTDKSKLSISLIGDSPNFNIGI